MTPIGVEALGFASATLICGSSVPQTIRTIRTRSAGDISWWYLAMFTVGSCGWLAYGLLVQQPPIYVANGVALVGMVALVLAKAAVARGGPRHASVAGAGGVDLSGDGASTTE